MRRVLMVAYHFPPVGGVGVERTLKHAEFLPEHGWQAVVVAPSHSAYRVVDPASVARIPPELEVHRAPTVEPAHLRRAVGRLVGRRRFAGAAPAPGGGAPRTDGGRSLAATARAMANRAWAAVVPRVFFPDDQLLWVPSVVAVGLIAHRRHAIDAVYSSAPPVSGHLAAAVLAERIGVPWIADFRDPWMGNAFVRDMPELHRRIGQVMERSMVARAERTVFATAAWRDRYADRYPWRAHRFVHIPNGYDRADLVGERPPVADDGTFRIIHPGSIYGERELRILLDGVELSLARDPGLRDRLRIDLVGWLSAPNQAVFAARAASVEPVVSSLAQRPRPEVLAMERAADAGLILIADDPGRDADVNAKLFEYLGLDLPVLAVAPVGESRAILDGLDWGVGVDPTAEGVAGGIRAIMNAPRPARPADPGGRYDRRALAAQMAELLDEVS